MYMLVFLLSVAIDDDIVNQAQCSFLSLQDVAHSLLKVFRSTGIPKGILLNKNGHTE